MKTLTLVLGIAMTIALGAVWLFAAPTIGTFTATPSTIYANTPTPVTVSAQITDSTLISNSVNLLRLGAAGTQPTILGQLHSSGSGIYTIQISLNEAIPGPIQLEVSAAFTGILKRIVSPPISVTARGLLLSAQTTLDPLIIIGTVTSITSSYQPPQSSSIVSDVVLVPMSAVKGGLPSAPISIRIPGGSVGNVTQQALGSGSLSVGQEVLLFLDGPDTNNRYTIPEGSLGIFHIVTNPSLGFLAVIDSGYKSIDLIQPLDPTFQALLSQSESNSLTLDALVAALKQP